MNNYADMSDHEINAAVASSLGVGFERHESGIYVSIKRDAVNVVSITGIVDYCNNWADAGPVMLENFISIDQHYNGSYARVWGYGDAGLIGLQCLRNDILRSAMIVFLMMKDAEK